ncbi:thiamine pyrophosphate-binding protein [Lachnospiraceae bacterium 42-17]|jgi:acetolactate synthase-1/2/3 large subunit|nr:thiamine pyrophosphate-binding protein [Dorea sp.]
MKKRVADIIIETLIENGITDCFAVVGGGAMYLDNALALNENIHKYFNHHEQACAMAAEAYARISGNMAAVCVTSGPGATNAITGVMGAWQDSLPMIVLSGQVRYAISVEKSGLPLRYRGIQEFEIIPSVKNMTKYAVMITDPLNIKYEVEKAIDIARDGRQGPVWLDIPQDIQNAQVDIEHLKRYNLKKDPLPLTDNEYKFILETLQKAKRPCILAGNGIANSGNTKAFRKMAEGLKVPVIAAAIAADVMYREHPLYYGLSGSIGPRTGNFIVQNADVILVLGCSMGFKMTGFAQEYFAPNATILAIDIDENEMKKPGVRIDYFFKCNLKDFFAGFEQFAKQIEISNTWRIYCDNLRKRFSPFEPSENLSPDERVCSYYFWKKYDDYETDNSISVLGNNTASSAKLQIGIRKENQRIVANNNCGSMGADLPEAIGASVASQKTVICLTGDGSIMMNLQELQTIHHYNLPVKIVIFSNDGYNAIRQTAKNFFNGKCIGCTPESGVSFPDFHSVADTFGFKYKCCNCNAEVEDSLKWLFSSEASVLLEVKQRLDDPVIPKVMTRLLDDGSYSTPAIQDMYPFLDKDDYDELMFW